MCSYKINQYCHHNPAHVIPEIYGVGLRGVALVGPHDGPALAAGPGHQVHGLLLPLVEVLLVGGHDQRLVDAQLLPKKQEVPRLLCLCQPKQENYAK